MAILVKTKDCLPIKSGRLTTSYFFDTNNSDYFTPLASQLASQKDEIFLSFTII